MIVCIQEHYDGESSIVWFADTAKARSSFADVINLALTDENKMVEVPYGKFGMQSEKDYDMCHVELPALVEASIEIFS